MRKVFIELKWVHFYFMLVVFSQCHLIKYEMVQLIFSAKNIALKANAVPFLVPTLSTTELLEQDSALFFGLPNFGFTYILRILSSFLLKQYHHFDRRKKKKLRMICTTFSNGP